MTTCPYCYRLVDYANHLHECEAVRFALDPAYTIYKGQPSSSDAADPSVFRGGATPQPFMRSPKKAAGLCATEGCNSQRTHGPYCHPHRLAILAKSNAKRTKPGTLSTVKHAAAAEDVEYLNRSSKWGWKR